MVSGWDLVVIGNPCTSTPGEDFDLLGLLLLPPIESANEWNCAPCPNVGEPPLNDLRPFSEILQSEEEFIVMILSDYRFYKNRIVGNFWGRNFHGSIRVIISRNAKTWHRWVWHTQISWRTSQKNVEFVNTFSVKSFLPYSNTLHSKVIGILS